MTNVGRVTHIRIHWTSNSYYNRIHNFVITSTNVSKTNTPIATTSNTCNIPLPLINRWSMTSIPIALYCSTRSCSTEIPPQTKRMIQFLLIRQNEFTTNDKYPLVTCSAEVSGSIRRHTSSQLRRSSSKLNNKATFDIVFVILMKNENALHIMRLFGNISQWKK